MTPSLREHLAGVHQLLIRASLNHQIWWTYKSKDTRPVYVKTMNEYLTFFSCGIHAHFLAYVVAMYAMYETRKDTYNCNQLVKLLAVEPGVVRHQLNEVKVLIAEAKPIWVKVGVLRNEVFGHLAAGTSSSEAFAKAAAKPDDLAHLLELSRRLLNAVRAEVGIGRHAYALTARDDTIKLLERLKAPRERPGG